MTVEAQQAKTVAIKACAACGGGLLEPDRFCRWCGVLQQSGTARTDEGLYRRVSGPLISRALAGVAVKPVGGRGPFSRKVLLALVSIPVWLMIVLLAPFDAYAAAKDMLREG